MREQFTKSKTHNRYDSSLASSVHNLRPVNMQFDTSGWSDPEVQLKWFWTVPLALFLTFVLSDQTGAAFSLESLYWELGKIRVPVQ